MERINITVHHFVTAVTIILTLTALILSSLAISGHIDYRDNSIEATAINNHSGLFVEHKTGDTSAVVEATVGDQLNANVVTDGDNKLSLGGVAVTASAKEINKLSGVNKHGNGFHVGSSGIIMEDANGSNYVILDSPANVTTNYTLTFPSSLAPGYLKADATGTITFAAANDNPKLHNVQNGDMATAITLTNDAAMTFGTTVGKLQLKAAADVELNADTGIIKLIDNTTTFGALVQTGNELVIKSGTTPTTAMTFAGADVTHAGDVSIVKDSDNAEMIISSHHDTEETTPLITLRKSDGTAAAPTLVDDNAVLGTLAFSGYDGAGYHVGAKIEARVNGTPSNGTDMPTELTFWTTPDAAGVPVERLVIDQDGSVDIKGTGTFKLAGTAVTSTAAELNLLDGSSAGTVVANKAVIHDGSGNVKVNDIIIADGGDIGSVTDTDAISISAGGVVSLSATTVSTSSTTGALTVAGGVGIAGVLSAGSTSTLTGDATFGGHIVADANEAKNIFAAVTSNTITVGGTGSTVAVDKLSVASTSTFSNTLTVGSDGVGQDVKFFGETAAAYMMWDHAKDQLKLVNATASTGEPLLYIHNNDTGNALKIDSTNAQGNTIHVQATQLTTGGILDIESTSPEIDARSLVTVHNNNAAAVGATVLTVINDAIASTAGQTVLFETTVASETNPLLSLKNSNADANGPILLLNNSTGTSPGSDNDVCGTINFNANDNQVTAVNQSFATVKATALAVTSGNEQGQLTIGVACTDDGGVDTILTIEGGVDAAGSTTTVAGNLDIPTGKLKINGTAVDATAAELNTYILTVRLDDISTASSCYVVAPKAGTLTSVKSIIDGLTATADAVITVNVNGGTDITNTLTIADGSGVATIDTMTPGGNNTITAGDYIKLTTNGNSTNTVKAVFTLEITY